MVNVSVELGQTPFEIVQTNVFTPTLIPLTVDVGELGVVTTPEPLITVHNPVPTAGVFPASIVLVAQMV